PYLMLADLQNTILSALLTFSDHVLYPYYTTVPRLAGQSALADQSAAGAWMWIPGSAAFLLPLFWVGVEFLFGGVMIRRHGDKETTRREGARIALPLAPSRRPSVSSGFDLLRVPILS